jgi:hypothetical protein
MGMTPRFCGSCGAALTNGGAFCGACGSAIVVDQPAPAPAPVEPAASGPAADATAAPDLPAAAPPPAPPGGNVEASAGTESGSVNQGLIAGVATAILALPAAIPGYFFAAWFFGDALSAILGHRVRRTGSYDWLISSVGGSLVGAFATSVAGWLLLTYFLRRADPSTYFRTGALAMLPVAAFWGTRGASGFSAAVWILFIWLGSLVGLWVISDLYREAAKTANVEHGTDGS